jgi:hydroxyacylglutathione hydrolase
MMKLDIRTIANGMVNCYLVKSGAGFCLIDTGVRFQRSALKKALNEAGCRPGDLKLVVITHADLDHTGNAAWLQERYRVPVAAHRDEIEAILTGRMIKNRKNPPGLFFRALVNFFSFFIYHNFKPDITVADGEDLNPYGIDARIVHIPGHSRGSIGVLTGQGDFFCGDLLSGSRPPHKNSLVDDAAEMDASVEKLKSLNIRIVYPGHDRPFTMDELLHPDST